MLVVPLTGKRGASPMPSGASMLVAKNFTLFTLIFPPSPIERPKSDKIVLEVLCGIEAAPIVMGEKKARVDTTRAFE
jgi:hypothetical protein